MSEPLADRDLMIESLLESRHPGYLEAYEEVEELLDDDDEFLASDEVSRENLLERKVMSLIKADWTEALGITEEQHQALSLGHEFAGALRNMPKAKLRFLYEEQESRRPQIPERVDEKWAFYNEPEATADFIHWAKADSWTLDEGVALCLGREPRVVTPKKLDSWGDGSEFASLFRRTLDLARRAQAAGVFGKHIVPEEFLNWADRKKIEYPTELRAALKHQGRDVDLWEQKYREAADQIDRLQQKVESLKAAAKEESELQGRPKPTFYKIVYLLAGKKDEGLKELDIPMTVSRICKKGALLGLAADDEPVRDCLKEAIEQAERKISRANMKRLDK